MNVATETKKTYSSYKHLLFERPEPGVLMVTMNRPEALNAMVYEMHTELTRLWGDIARDDETLAVVITGAGRAFSAGNDLKQPEPSPAQVFQIMQEARDIVYGMTRLEKPIVTAINGPAVGAGLAIALLADVSIAAEDAKLIDAHVRLGTVSGDHAAIVWPLLCSMAKAKYYLLTNEPILGREAERIGLVTMSLPNEEVLPKALEVASKLVHTPRQAVAWTKRVMNHWMMQASPIYDLSAAYEMVGFFSTELQEAKDAFREKREPDFKTTG
jgi:enoyl-CoA hydratase